MCGLLVTLGKTLVATIKFKSEDMEHYLIPGTTVSLSKLVDYVILYVQTFVLQLVRPSAP